MVIEGGGAMAGDSACVERGVSTQTEVENRFGFVIIENTCASCSRVRTVMSSIVMGIRIDRLAATSMFEQALRLARSESPVPEHWVDKTKRVASSKNITFLPVLGTALLAKATDRRVDAFSLREDEGHKSYSARSLAKDVFVPCCRTAGIDIRTTGAEPLNNQPFLRAEKISDGLKVRKSTVDDLRFLCECLTEADFLEDDFALMALAAFLRSRVDSALDSEVVAIDGTALAIGRLISAIENFVVNHVEGGRVGQALVAAVMDLVFEDVRTRRINDPSRGWTGDVGVFVGGRLSMSIEVKQRSMTKSEILQFMDRLVSDGVRRGLVAALAQVAGQLDARRLESTALERFGLHLDIVVGIRRLLLDTLRYVPNQEKAVALLPEFGLKRLRDIESSETVLAAWVKATTE